MSRSSKTGPTNLFTLRQASLIAFVSSGALQQALEAGIMVARLIQRQMAADPDLRYTHVGTMLGLLRAGCLHLAAWKVYATGRVEGDPSGAGVMEGMADDVALVAAWLDAMGRRFTAFGAFTLLPADGSRADTIWWYRGTLCAYLPKAHSGRRLLPFPSGSFPVLEIEESEVEVMRLRRSATPQLPDDLRCMKFMYNEV